MDQTHKGREQILNACLKIWLMFQV